MPKKKTDSETRGRPANEHDTSTFLGQIGAEIRRRRERAKLSVAAAAEAAGVQTLSWYRWESGRHLQLEKLPTVAAALGCKVRALIPE